MKLPFEICLAQKKQKRFAPENPWNAPPKPFSIQKKVFNAERFASLYLPPETFYIAHCYIYAVC